LTRNYFLSHFHSDHYGGIDRNWSFGVIYCSLPTAELVHSQLGVERKYLHPLPVGIPNVLESGTSGGHGRRASRAVTVTLLEANHCPGAIMFLFEIPASGGIKRVLHVGDFRWDRNVMLGGGDGIPSPLRDFANLRTRLDELYLDTTYCDPKYATMPTQAEAIEAGVAAAVAESEGDFGEEDGGKKRKRRRNTLFLFGSYTIGKERIYLSAARALDTKVYVDPRKYRILSSLGWSPFQMDLLTTNKSESRLWVVPMGHLNFQKMGEYVGEANRLGGRGGRKALSAGYDRASGFRPTGWTHGGGRGAQKPKKPFSSSSSRNDAGGKGDIVTVRRSGPHAIYGVPYSEHSSFAELVDCLIALKPKKIVPTVSVSKGEEQVRILLEGVGTREREGRALEDARMACLDLSSLGGC